jgi:hypothetical protein
VARTLNHCCNKSTILHSVYCWCACHQQLCKNIEYCTTMILWQIYVAENNKTYLGLHVNCPMLHWNKKSSFFLVVITNKMQLSYGIYYFTYVNSSTCFERYVAHHQEPQQYLSLWFTNACGIRPWCCLTAPRADSASVCKPEVQIQLRFLVMSDIALETC